MVLIVQERGKLGTVGLSLEGWLRRHVARDCPCLPACGLCRRCTCPSGVHTLMCPGTDLGPESVGSVTWNIGVRRATTAVTILLSGYLRCLGPGLRASLKLAVHSGLAPSPLKFSWLWSESTSCCATSCPFGHSQHYASHWVRAWCS